MKNIVALILLLFVAVVIAISCAIKSTGTIDGLQQDNERPVLYLVTQIDGEERISIAEPKLVTSQTCIVISTHGWLERTLWPQDLALALQEKIDPGTWICGWFDWRSRAMVVNPTDAAKYGRETAGPILGEKIVELSESWEHIHLIGHSAGSWVINEAAKIIAEQSDAEIHLTYLDAYVPTSWNEDELGQICDDPNFVCWSEHYFTRDITLGVTEKLLKHARNVDLTQVTPGLNDHKFPWHWYLATVIGKYADGQRYEGEKLFYKAGSIEYGFARSLEAGPDDWKISTELKPFGQTVKILPKD